MLHNSEAGPAEVPPFLASTLADVHCQTWPARHAVSGKRKIKCSGLLQKMSDFSSQFRVKLSCFTVVVHTVSEAGLWLHQVWLFLFFLFWFRLRWLIVHCAAHWRISIIQSTHRLVKNYSQSSVTKPPCKIYTWWFCFPFILSRLPHEYCNK